MVTRSSDVWGQEKMDGPDQEERENSPSLCFFVLGGPLAGWMVPADIGEEHLLSSVHWLKC